MPLLQLIAITVGLLFCILIIAVIAAAVVSAAILSTGLYHYFPFAVVAGGGVFAWFTIVVLSGLYFHEKIQAFLSANSDEGE